MKLPVVSGAKAVAAFRKLGYEHNTREVATLSCVIRTRHIDAFRFPTTAN